MPGNHNKGTRQIGALAKELGAPIGEFLDVLHSYGEGHLIPADKGVNSFVDPEIATAAWNEELAHRAELEAEQTRLAQEAQRAEEARLAEEARQAAASVPPTGTAATLMANRLNGRAEVLLTVTTRMIGEAIGQPNLKDNDPISINEQDLLNQLVIRNPLVIGRMRDPQPATQPGDDLHAVESFAPKIPDITIGALAAELNTSQSHLAELAELAFPWTPDTMVNAEEVRGLYLSRQARVGEGSQSTTAALLPIRGRDTMVAAGREVKVTRDDKVIIDNLLVTIRKLLSVYPYRPLDTIRLVYKGGGKTLDGVNVPTLLDPTHFTWLEAMEYYAKLQDPEGSFLPMNERQLHSILREMEGLSFIPKRCVNCLSGQGFGLGLEGKFWNLLNGYRSKDQVYIRFFLPERRREFEALYRSLGLTSDRFKVMEFRQSHDECVIIAYEVKKLASTSRFKGVDWYDPAVRKAFLRALVPIVIGRIPEIAEKTRGNATREIVLKRLSLVVKTTFDNIDNEQVRQRAGQQLREGNRS